jgi:predicted nucleic acid-binding Zn ribbon protein
MEQTKKACQECGKHLFGRSDKKFCSDNCRNQYNYKRTHVELNLVRNINGILKRNRRILSDLNPEGKVKVHREKLLLMGFNFNYFTNLYKTRKGTVYHFVYEQGYMELDEQYLYLVQRQSYID